jgi:methylenetetrahydrofolate dehydrogenase (NADP+)/methenyltetrahydrofolate cyclohydrolase
VYTNIKARKAREMGVDIEAISQLTIADAAEKIQMMNGDSTVDGIMVQLPYSNSQILIDLIDPKKDVDGLRKDSSFKPAVVRAVMEILTREVKISQYEGVMVVGNRGEVGGRLQKELGCLGMDREDFPTSIEKLLRASVVISATGQSGLIHPGMVKEGVVAIDVGYPKGDFDPEVAKKAAFFTPVPGGVGPVTVVMLFANLSEVQAET